MFFIYPMGDDKLPDHPARKKSPTRYLIILTRELCKYFEKEVI